MSAVSYLPGAVAALTLTAATVLIVQVFRALRRRFTGPWWAHRTGDAERAQANALKQQHASRRVPTSSNTPPLPTARAATRPPNHHHGKRAAA